MADKELYYFVSDIHLGLDYKDPKERERRFALFLQNLPPQTKKLFLLGDIFDFWYEYKNVIPNRYTRVLGALASLVDRGVEVHFFNGNHDIWTYRFFEQELGLVMERNQPAVVELCGKRFCMGHGDGLDPKDTGYKLLKWLFTNRVAQVMFSALHPRWAFGFGYSWSRHNRLSKGEQFQFRGAGEPLVKFAEQFQSLRGESQKIDYFVFGHYHYNAQYQLPCGGELFMMGEWIHHYDYLVFDGETVVRKHFAPIV